MTSRAPHEGGVAAPPPPRLRMDRIPNFASDSAGVLGHVGGNLVRVCHPWEVAEVLCAPGTLAACKVAKAYFGRTASGTVEEHARRMRGLTPVAMQATDAAILTGLLPETRTEGLALGMSEDGASMVEPFHELNPSLLNPSLRDDHGCGV